MYSRAVRDGVQTTKHGDRLLDHRGRGTDVRDIARDDVLSVDVGSAQVERRNRVAALAERGDACPPDAGGSTCDERATELARLVHRRASASISAGS
jgi:hypothetical protein